MNSNENKVGGIWLVSLIGLVLVLTGILTPTFWNSFESLTWWGIQTSSTDWLELDIGLPSMVCFVLMLILNVK